MSELRQEAEAIAEQFSDHLDVDADEVEERLENLVNEYRVPLDEARRSVTNSYLEDAGMERDELGRGGSESVLVDEIDEDEQWVDLRVNAGRPLGAPQRLDLAGRTPRRRVGHDQVRRLRDLRPPRADGGQAYELSNVVTDEYEGSYSVKLNRTTGITEIDEEIEVGDNADTVEGALVDIQSGSGLIKRCPEDDCTRVLQNGRCSEHGQVEGEFDLRIKGVLDDGETVTEVIFDREATEKLTGMGLEEAKDMAMDALDTTVVAEEMADDVLGRYYRVTGPTFGRYVLVDEMEEPGRVDVESALIEARSI